MRIIRIIGSPLYQWEVGRKLEIVSPIGDCVSSVHFCHLGDASALVVEPKTENGLTVVDIPNILLQSGDKIVAYCVSVSEDCTEIIQDCVFHVCPRPKPDDYVYTETEVLTWEALDQRITKLEKTEPGQGGYSPTAKVEQTETGATITITDKDGTTTATIVNGKDGKDGVDGKDGSPGKDGQNGADGKNGADGYTPVRGIDYYTEADKAEMVESVLAAMPAAEGVSY